MNYLEGDDGKLAEVAGALIHSRVAMGGPDILPFRQRLQSTYQLYVRFHGRLKLFCSAQEDSYRHDRNDSRNMGNATTLRNQPPPVDGYVPHHVGRGAAGVEVNIGRVTADFLPSEYAGKD